MLEGATILLTGGAGFIGTSLCRRLADHNRILVLDTLRRNALAESGLDQHPNVELTVGDVCDRPTVDRLTQRADYVVHMASIAGVDTVIENPVRRMSCARPWQRAGPSGSSTFPPARCSEAMPFGCTRPTLPGSAP
jgi:nucleoside-diphosphate-sugar epimerase